MKQEVRTAFAVATAANAAAQFARTAENLARVNPSEWELVDQAYWLCRAAASKAEAAADALDPEWADLDETVTYAHATANGAAQLSNEAADDLVSLAEANNHSIRRRVGGFTFSRRNPTMKDYTYRTFRIKGQLFSVRTYVDGRIYVQSIHPYDETEYHWAWFPGREDDYWGIYRNGQFVARTRDFYDGADLSPEDVAAVLLDLDERANLKPRMVHN